MPSAISDSLINQKLLYGGQEKINPRYFFAAMAFQFRGESGSPELNSVLVANGVNNILLLANVDFEEEEDGGSRRRGRGTRRRNDRSSENTTTSDDTASEHKERKPRQKRRETPEAVSEGDNSSTPTGLGDHVPAFLLREFK